MREERKLEARGGDGRQASRRSGSELERRYPVALALYALLAVLVWFTMDGGKVLVLGKAVDLRLLPLIVLGGLSLRTVLAVHADKMRRDGDGGGSGSR